VAPGSGFGTAVVLGVARDWLAGNEEAQSELGSGLEMRAGTAYRNSGNSPAGSD
jgi:hypothetical protein